MTKVRKQIKRNRLNINREKRKFNIQECCNYCLSFFVITISVLAFSFCGFIILPNVVDTWLFRLLNFFIGLCEVTLLLTSFIKTVITSPGYVESDWDMNIPKEESEEILSLERSLKDGEKRYCRHCNIYKPPRVHHSQTFGKCVLRMDHYCIWVNNVVGLYNTKFFYLFLIYAITCLLHFFGFSIFSFIKLVMNFKEVKNFVLFFILLLLMAFLCPLGMVLSMFISWTGLLLCTNQTSIEYHRNKKIKKGLERHYGRKRKDVPVKVINIYNVGIFKNICAIMGEKWWNWLNPFVGINSDGIHFDHIDREKVEHLNDCIREASGKKVHSIV